MPIIELRASREQIAKAGGLEAASYFCASLRSDVIDPLAIPDDSDYETRITASEAGPAVIKCDLTEGPNKPITKLNSSVKSGSMQGKQRLCTSQGYILSFSLYA